MKYYKTTRMDGSSWYDPGFVYREGRIYRPRRGTLADTYYPCTDGVLHACGTPEVAADSLWGVRWPFRLWSFDGTPVTAGWSKYGFRQVGPMVVEDVAQCFGPNGAQVVTLLNLLTTINLSQARELFFTDESTNWFAARARVEVAGCVVSRGLFQDIAGGTACYIFDTRRALLTIQRAAAALVVADLVGEHNLKQHHVDTLLSPIVNAFGEDWMNQ